MKFTRLGTWYRGVNGPGDHATQFWSKQWIERIWPYNGSAVDEIVLMPNYSVWQGITKAKGIEAFIKAEAKCSAGGYAQCDVRINGSNHLIHTETTFFGLEENRNEKHILLPIPLTKAQTFRLEIGIGVAPEAGDEAATASIKIAFFLNAYAK